MSKELTLRRQNDIVDVARYKNFLPILSNDKNICYFDWCCLISYVTFTLNQVHNFMLIYNPNLFKFGIFQKEQIMSINFLTHSIFFSKERDDYTCWWLYEYYRLFSWACILWPTNDYAYGKKIISQSYCRFFHPRNIYLFYYVWLCFKIMFALYKILLCIFFRMKMTYF